MSIETLKKQIKDGILAAIEKAFEVKFESEIKLEIPPEEQNSDFAFACFPLSKILRNAPFKIASQIAKHFPETDFLEEVKAVGPFLNFNFKKESFFKTVIEQILEESENFGSTDFGKKQKFLVEYSSPTTNKPLHLGHIRNNFLGISISRILEMAGYEVETVCLYNDRGIQICKSMLYYEKFENGNTPEKVGMKPDHYVGDLYVKFSKLEKEQPELTEEVQGVLQKWEDGDEATVSLWKKMSDWVYEGYNETYKRLGSSFDYTQYESDTYKLGKEISLKGLEKGVFFQKEDSSIWIDLTDEGLDEKLVVRKDGTTVYITQDFGTAVERSEKINFDKMIYIVGNEQEYHFQVLFKILKKYGFGWASECFHLSYGMVDLPSGKMKSREGTVVDADQLLDELKNIAKEKMRTNNDEMDETEIEELAEAIGHGAISFFILKVHPNKRILFNPSESVDFQGMTGTYLQYSHTRICSILRKFGKDLPTKIDFSLLAEPEEIALLRLISNFPEIVKEAAIGQNPSKIASFSYLVAKNFSKFYDRHSVLSLENESQIEARVALLQAVKITLANSLYLLGIKAVEKM